MANISAAAIGLASLTFTARALSPDDFGLLMLVQVYILVISQLISFRTWQPLIKYGSDALANGNKGEFSAALRTAFIVDITTAVVGFFIAWGGSFPIGYLLSWEQATYELVAVYCFVILFNVSGHGTAILRIFDRFDLVATHQFTFQLIRFIAIVICWQQGFGLLAFVNAWVLSEVLSYLLLIVLGWIELRKRNIGLFDQGKFNNFKSFLEFLVSNNLDSSIRMISRQLDVLLVGLFLGQAQAGIYRLAIQLSGFATRFTDPLYNILLPEFSKLVSAQNYSALSSLMKRVTFLAAALFVLGYLLISLFGEPVIGLLFGESYRGVFNVLLIYLLAIGLATVFITIVPFLHAHGMARTCLKAQTYSTVLYCLALVPLVYFGGLYGAAIAYVLYHIFWFKAIWPITRTKLAGHE
jgi:O-antigen/teichoic acid export membrane protein